MTVTVPIWGVEAGERAVNAVRLRLTADGGIEVLSWWSVPVPPGADPLVVAVDAMRRRGLHRHGVQVALPGRGATCRAFRIAPDCLDLPEDELVRELHDFTPFEPPEVLLRFRRLGGPGALDYRVVTERRDELGRWEEALERAGFRWFGLTLAPTALLAAVEAFKVAPARGYVFQLGARWSTLTALDGPLSVRYPIPLGIADVERALEGAGPAGRGALDAVPGAPGTEPAWQAVLGATEALGADLLRAIEYHRAAVHGTGEETLLLLGPDVVRPGLRAALAQRSPVPLAPLWKAEALAPLRPAPRVRPEDLLAALPSLVPALGAAMAPLGAWPADLDFRNLPEDTPAPQERTLYPLAAAALLAAVGGAAWLAAGSRAVLAEGEESARSLRAAAGAAPPPAGGNGEAGSGEVRLLAAEVRRRAALARAFEAAVEAFPSMGPSGRLPARAEEVLVQQERGGYRVALRLRAGEVPAGHLRSRLEDSGWRFTGEKEGVLSFARLVAVR